MNDRVMSRRAALKMLGAAAIGVATTSRLVDRAAAGRGWCYADPLFQIGDDLFDVALSADLEMLTSASGPVRLTLFVPDGVNATHIVSDLGFGYGYQIEIVSSAHLRVSDNHLDVAVLVNAPAHDSSIPVAVTMTSLSGEALVARAVAHGYANQEIDWSGRIETVLPLKLLT